MPRPGDWVKATGTIPVRWSDHLSSNAGIQPGTRGVVISQTQGWWNPTVKVRFDAGITGTCEVTAPVNKVRVSRRKGGVEAFDNRARWTNLLRLGVAIGLSVPLVYFVVVYLWTYRSFDGLLTALVASAIDSAIEAAQFLFSHPVEALVFFGVSWLLGKFAFR